MFKAQIAHIGAKRKFSLQISPVLWRLCSMADNGERMRPSQLQSSHRMGRTADEEERDMSWSVARVIQPA